MNRRAIVLALAAFAAVLAPATESHASGFSFAFATPPQVTTPGSFSSAITALASVDGDMTIDVTALQGTTITATGDAGCTLTPSGGEHCVVRAAADVTVNLPFDGAYSGSVVALDLVASDASGPVTFVPDTLYPVLPVNLLTLPTPAGVPVPPTMPPVMLSSATTPEARQAAIARLLHRRTKVVDLTNAQRAASGLGALTVNADLQRSAQRYVNHLAADGAFSHTDGSVLGTRVTQAGYLYTFVGENLALGQTSPRSVVAAWMASPEHRANMLDGRFTEMGVGVARRSDGRLLWCIDFGWPKA